VLGEVDGSCVVPGKEPRQRVCFEMILEVRFSVCFGVAMQVAVSRYIRRRGYGWKERPR
jgi:hypothetical protein